MRTDREAYKEIKGIFEDYAIFRVRAKNIANCISDVRNDSSYTMIFDENELIEARNNCISEIEKVNSALKSVNALDNRLYELLKLVYLNGSNKNAMDQLNLSVAHYYRLKKQAINLFLDCYVTNA
ncbi:DUF1492 domain-containing protein [Fructilactobacillus frigidiflavus]|uniref:DUF1492 domain-containing protein n=1 Tax=Fructilactobacillus frigidiflavus TaxID=3242688 RepID=UPI003756FC4B